jgi:acyl-CoA thioester hydrolase
MKNINFGIQIRTMENFSIRLQVRWSDIDANRHLRHSVYYDYGALCRMEILSRIGLTTGRLEELAIGPILFREEAVFRREVIFEDNIRITAEIIKATPDYSRWSIRHTILKEDETLAAVITVDGAWIDLSKRKLAIPDAFVQSTFDQIPKSKEFEIVLKKEK